MKGMQCIESEDEELTIYYEGHHHRIPKINPHEAITIAQDVQKN